MLARASTTSLAGSGRATAPGRTRTRTSRSGYVLLTSVFAGALAATRTRPLMHNPINFRIAEPPSYLQNRLRRRIKGNLPLHIGSHVDDPNGPIRVTRVYGTEPYIGNLSPIGAPAETLPAPLRRELSRHRAVTIHHPKLRKSPQRRMGEKRDSEPVRRHAWIDGFGSNSYRMSS